MAWGVLQAGDWGRQHHRAWAYALELGYQLAAVPAAPWLRIGWDRSSGDGNPGDGDHETFFQLLPTARPYAQFPFYNLMNSEDLFAQLLVQPHPLVGVRVDYHWLRVSERRDLWYAGGGASNEKLFGFSGVPTGREREIAQLADLGITLGLLNSSAPSHPEFRPLTGSRVRARSLSTMCAAFRAAASRILPTYAPRGTLPAV